MNRTTKIITITILFLLVQLFVTGLTFKLSAEVLFYSYKNDSFVILNGNKEREVIHVASKEFLSSMKKGNYNCVKIVLEYASFVFDDVIEGMNHLKKYVCWKNGGSKKMFVYEYNKEKDVMTFYLFYWR